MSTLFVVGIGPGGLNHMTLEAREAISRAEVVVGYQTYLGFIEPLLSGKDVVSSGMTREVERCRRALQLAASGKEVALVSSGDAGIYGMAGLALELAAEPDFNGAPPEIVVVPGVSALQAAAAVLGAPLMHDFAVISLSDLLTPWDLIERRLRAAADADFVIALYNPRSKGRVRHLEEAQRILLSTRAAGTPVGIVRNACRSGEEKTVTNLGDMLSCHVDMFSVVIIGNSSTYLDAGRRIITPRGYRTGAEGGASGAKADTTAPLPGQSSGAAVMFCGTASDVGKSVITAGFCRILKNRGIAVAPFKSQNMALNSAVTPEGGEIGRAQAVQAEACGLAPHTDMNPVLLKPSSDTGSQVIIQGKPVRHMTVAEYNRYKPEAFLRVRESFDRLRNTYRFVVIEGAGSIAEINLKAHDIANLAVAEMADCPVILIADIDRGGVFAQIVGTVELLDPQERARVQGVIINKFRGDPTLLSSGIDFVERRTGIPVLGVIPCFTGFHIPDEDSVALQKRQKVVSIPARKQSLVIGVVRLSRISNFTDFDPLDAEPDVEVRYIEGRQQLEGLDLLILPGSKTTVADLYLLMERGLYDAIRDFRGPIMGICGGYQMLGRRVLDPHGVESNIREARGLGLLDAETVMLPEKTTHQVTAHLLDAGLEAFPHAEPGLAGYEIHMGDTALGAGARPFARIATRSGSEAGIEDGAVSPDNRVVGTYLHGIFENEGFRRSLLNRLRAAKGLPVQEARSSAPDSFDLLAEHLERHLDMERLFAICGLPDMGGM
ncbi:cobyric acid synthase [Geobacter sp. DSM 9736]|uniref:cobyric acid synthase n=1 Tax=Geobacter sp. DSM 9736 TaxID=1277350 RepID=UPI000B5055D5|nr:cobyric acid synthase [Geobacter sp. DSM 9736]SNB46973.1 adenosylcobyric acid synthase (glutamine-hydrolysing) [Geobacter sp. DSM 9736]